MTEQYIQSRIREKLIKAGWFVTKIIVCSTPGFPDLLCLKDGKTVLIEVKAPGKKPSELQNHIHKKLKCFEVIVADDVEAVKHLI
jgi:Holliday junction resolvase